MSNNVYRAKTVQGNSRNPNALTVEERMNHEILIDLFKAVCRHYGIKYKHIAKNLYIRKEYIYSILNKRQYVPAETFIDMCEVLKLMVKCSCRIRDRQLVIPL